jgi:hypothetical protein
MSNRTTTVLTNKNFHVTIYELKKTKKNKGVISTISI